MAGQSRRGVECATSRLEEEAADLGENLLVVDDKKTVAKMGLDAMRGLKFVVFGTAYFCVPENGEDGDRETRNPE